MRADNEGPELYRQFEVLACTGALSFSGTLRCGFSQRLVDALNEGLWDETFAKIEGFLPLSNVRMTGPGRVEQKLPGIYISKNNIIFVAQISGKEAEKPLSTYPYREKLPVVAVAYAGRASEKPYKLSGRIYLDSRDGVIHILEAGARFLPMTNAEIHPPPPGARSKFDFVALNKEQIISIHQSEE